MTQTLLETVRWRDHRAALRWLGMLYRRPHLLKQALEEQTRGRSFMLAGWLLLHALPYLFLLDLVARLLLLHVVGRPVPGLLELGIDTVGGIAGGFFGGTVGGIGFGLFFGIAAGIALGITLGIAAGITAGMAGGIDLGSDFGIAFGITID